MMRLLWACLGLSCVGFGLIGIFLPLVPTVPLMLLAAFCFARSSERLHMWILSHPQFGPSINHWRERRAINARAKRLATVSIVAVFLISLLLGVRPLLLGIQAAVLLAVLIFIWSRPDA